MLVKPVVEIRELGDAGGYKFEVEVWDGSRSITCQRTYTREEAQAVGDHNAEWFFNTMKIRREFGSRLERMGWNQESYMYLASYKKKVNKTMFCLAIEDNEHFKLTIKLKKDDFYEDVFKETYLNINDALDKVMEWLS